MRKSKQRKLEKKRKQERERRRQQPTSLAYHGNKYKIGGLLRTLFSTEAGIYESFVMSERKLTDHDVRRVVEGLIRGIRGGAVRLPAQTDRNEKTDEEPEDNLIAANIRRHWEEYSGESPFPGRDGLIGVLRTILGSIEVWGNINPASRGYLRYLEGFMAQLGVHCQQVPADFDLATLEDANGLVELPEPLDSELLMAGRAWLGEGDLGAHEVFCALANEMIAIGEAEEVTDTCRQLMGEINDSRVLDELGYLFARAQQHLRLTAP